MRNSAWVWIVTVCLGALMTGCKAPGQTKEQVHMRHADTIHQNMLQFQDDIDAVFLFDRPSRAARMYVR